MTPRSLYFELESYDRFHRSAWEERLAGWFAASPKVAVRAERAADAEFIIEPQSWHSLIDGKVFSTAVESHYKQRPEATFAWDSGDFPTGRLPGLYCSLNPWLADPVRHRSFCYPLRANPLVRECPLSDALYLFGFSGNITAPLRGRIFSQLQGSADKGLALLRQTESIFHRLYCAESDADRARFMDDMRRCRFVLCPRGNGLSSMRLFETMEAARVPAIISDRLILPQCVDWSSCSVRVPESDIGRLPEILAGRENDWQRLARNARSEWERCFSDASLLQNMVGQLRDIVGQRIRPEKNQRYFFPFRVLPDYTRVRAKQLVRCVQSLAHPKA
jgi:hypothetical protein